MIGYVAIHYLVNRKRQALISVVGVMLGVAFFIAISGMLQGMHQFFIKRLVDAYPHVKISDEFREPQAQPVVVRYPDAVTIIRGLKPKEETQGVRNYRQIVEGLKEMPGLTYSPITSGQAFLRYGGRDVSTTVYGVDPRLERNASKLARDMKKGQIENLMTTSNGIILGRALADKIGLDMGARLNVVSPVGVIMQMKVVGIFDSGVTQVDSGTSYANIKKVQVLQNKVDKINQINIRLEDVDSAPAVATALERKFRYKAESWQEAFQNIFELFVVQNGIMYTTVSVILLVAGFGIYNIISSSVMEKYRDIAILKSMGFSESDVVGIFFFQGVVIGIIGVLAGWACGAGLVEILASVKLSLNKDVPVRMDGFPMFRSVWLYAAGGIMGLLSAAFAAWIPARRAARLHPVDIIRGASG